MQKVCGKLPPQILVDVNNLLTEVGMELWDREDYWSSLATKLLCDSTAVCLAFSWICISAFEMQAITSSAIWNGYNLEIMYISDNNKSQSRANTSKSQINFSSRIKTMLYVDNKQENVEITFNHLTTFEK